MVLYRKFTFWLVTKQEMKNKGNHTYTESHSENSDTYLVPRGKSGLRDRKRSMAFHKVLSNFVLTRQLRGNGYCSRKCLVKASLARHPFETLRITIAHS